MVQKMEMPAHGKGKTQNSDKKKKISIEEEIAQIIYQHELAFKDGCADGLDTAETIMRHLKERGYLNSKKDFGHECRFHPGEFVKEELEARGWTIEDLAYKSELNAAGLREIISGNRKITPVYALGLANAFGTSKDIWLNLQHLYRILWWATR